MVIETDKGELANCGFLKGKKLYRFSDLVDRGLNPYILEGEGNDRIQKDLRGFINEINSNGVSNSWVGTLRQIPYCVESNNMEKEFFRVIYIEGYSGGNGTRRAISVDKEGRFRVRKNGTYFLNKDEIKHIWAWDRTVDYLRWVGLTDDGSTIGFVFDKYFGEHSHDFLMGAGSLGSDFFLPQKRGTEGYYSIPVENTLGIHGPDYVSLLRDWRIYAKYCGGGFEGITPSALIIADIERL